MEQFGREQVTFEFFDAITPDQAQVIFRQWFPHAGIEMLSAGELACLVSHLSVWQQAKAQGLAWVAVFEDDVHLGQDVGQYLNDAGWLSADWPLIKLETFNQKTITSGTIALSVGQRVLARLGAVPDAPTPEALNTDALRALEPAIAPGLLAWHLPGEGQVLPRETLVALATQAPGVRWHWRTRIDNVSPGRLLQDDGTLHAFDIAIDTRGLGARPQLPLRGVRGELVWLHAPGVALHRPLRLLHPRHRVYLVPRPGGRIVVGASEIESEDRSPPSLRSVVELLSAAHSVLPELAEARIEHLESNLRPARSDNAPFVEQASGLLRINGLFRHG